MPDEIKILDAEQAAQALRMTTRRLIKVAKKHGLCLIYGRQIMFTASQLADIVEVMKCPSTSSAAIETHSTSEPAMAPEKAFSSLRALAIERSRKRTRPKPKSG